MNWKQAKRDNRVSYDSSYTEDQIFGAWNLAQDSKKSNHGYPWNWKIIASQMLPYGDLHLYVDKDGNYWEEYFSIGD